MLFQDNLVGHLVAIWKNWIKTIKNFNFVHTNARKKTLWTQKTKKGKYSIDCRPKKAICIRFNVVT